MYLSYLIMGGFALLIILSNWAFYILGGSPLEKGILGVSDAVLLNAVCLLVGVIGIFCLWKVFFLKQTPKIYTRYLILISILGMTHLLWPYLFFLKRKLGVAVIDVLTSFFIASYITLKAKSLPINPKIFWLIYNLGIFLLFIYSLYILGRT